MILDARNEFCNATSVALTAGASWQNVGNQIPVLPLALNTAGTDYVNTDIGAGEPLYLVIRVTTGIDIAANTGTIAFRLTTDDSATLHASTSTVIWTSASIATNPTIPAGLLAGATIAVVALPQNITYEEYLGIQVLVTTETTTAGAIDAFLTKDVAKWSAFADARN